MCLSARRILKGDIHLQVTGGSARGHTVGSVRNLSCPLSGRIQPNSEAPPHYCSRAIGTTRQVGKNWTLCISGVALRHDRARREPYVEPADRGVPTSRDNAGRQLREAPIEILKVNQNCINWMSWRVNRKAGVNAHCSYCSRSQS